jgi:hypothetical protein
VVDAFVLLAQGQAGDSVWGVVVLMLGLALYFVPTMVAAFRRHHNTLAIGALNFFLGWTFIGWVAALVWALTRVQSSDTPDVHRRDFS